MGQTGLAKEAIIKVENVGKVFTKKAHGRSLKGSVISLGDKLVGKTEKTLGSSKFVALEEVSFDVKKGEFFGIVGRNGSGKSTLLKILAGVYQPSSGSISVNGKLTPFIELGVGFNPELSGHDNVFLNGALLGFSRKQMRAMYADIVDFAELDGFMDVKLKNYSSGMQVRLAFSIATRCESDILLLDEVLAVGDAVFQQKCFDYFSEIKKSGRTVCFVSHDAETMRKYCDRGVLIKNGKVVLISNITAVLNEYQNDLSESIETQENKKAPTRKSIHSIGLVINPLVISQNGNEVKTVRAHKHFQLGFNLECNTAIQRPNIGVNIINQQGQLIHAFNSQQLDTNLNFKKGINTVQFDVENVLTDGKYTVNVAVVDMSSNRLLYQQEGACDFRVTGVIGHKYSLIHPKVKMVTK